MRGAEMAKFIFIMGVMVVFVTAMGAAASPARERLWVVGIGGGALLALAAWLLLFCLLFGVAA